jgi:hypothetical protein
MKDIISKKQKHLLWQDELGDDFILLKYAEVYKYSENTLRLFVWSKKYMSQLQKIGVVLNEIETDDNFTIIETKVENLLQIIALGSFKRRPSIKGKWIKSKEAILAHKILPYRPKELNNEN